MQASIKANGRSVKIEKQGDRRPSETIGESLRQKHPRVESKIWTSFYIFRLASLVLTSGVYLLQGTDTDLLVPIVSIFLLFIYSHLMLFVYTRSLDNAKKTSLIILFETLAIALLLIVTGGMTSPFIWYALNPIIVSSIYLPPIFCWLYLSTYFFVIALEDIYISVRTDTLREFFVNNASLLLILGLVTLALQILSRVSSILSDQSQMLRQQQDELYSAFSALSENHHMIQSLSEYQRETVSFKDEKDILLKLTTACEACFPFTKSAVLLLHKPLPPSYLFPKSRYSVISAAKEDLQEGDLKELTDNWQDLISQKMLTGAKKDWLAMPIWHRQKLMAVFIAWVRPGTNLNSFPGNLSFFVYYTEQVLGGLLNLKQTERTLQHMSSLYEAVETISSRDEIREVIDLFAAYARALTGCEKAIFWVDQVNKEDAGGEGSNFIYTVKGHRRLFPEKYWYPELLKAWSRIKEDPQPLEFTIEKPGGEYLGRLTCVPVKSRSKCFGVLAVLQSENIYTMEEIMQTLSFLANLAAVSIERSLAEVFSDKMLLIEEQNRIANEIHDSVSQNLFSVVYGVDALIKQADTLPLELQKQLLSTIRDVTAQTSKELRILIYRLSPRHRGDDTFVKELQAYLNNLAELNQINIQFNVQGKEEYMNSAMRRAFYRILKESTSNAVRHGKCSEIQVDLTFNPFESQIIVKDNGIGFEPEIYGDRQGATSQLGLLNMRELATSLKGNLHIESKNGEGTTVMGSVPTSPVV